MDNQIATDQNALALGVWALAGLGSVVLILLCFIAKRFFADMKEVKTDLKKVVGNDILHGEQIKTMKERISENTKNIENHWRHITQAQKEIIELKSRHA